MLDRSRLYTKRTDDACAEGDRGWGRRQGRRSERWMILAVTGGLARWVDRSRKSPMDHTQVLCERAPVQTESAKNSG
jgi:hypothetical protein